MLIGRYVKLYWLRPFWTRTPRALSDLGHWLNSLDKVLGETMHKWMKIPRFGSNQTIRGPEWREFNGFSAIQSVVCLQKRKNGSTNQKRGYGGNSARRHQELMTTLRIQYLYLLWCVCVSFIIMYLRWKSTTTTLTKQETRLNLHINAHTVSPNCVF